GLLGSPQAKLACELTRSSIRAEPCRHWRKELGSAEPSRGLRCRSHSHAHSLQYGCCDATCKSAGPHYIRLRNLYSLENSNKYCCCLSTRRKQIRLACRAAQENDHDRSSQSRFRPRPYLRHGRRRGHRLFRTADPVHAVLSLTATVLTIIAPALRRQPS